MKDRNHHHNHHGNPPRWKQVHRSWIFWVAVFLMLFAMIGYLATGDLSWGLFHPPAQSTSPASGR